MSYIIQIVTVCNDSVKYCLHIYMSNYMSSTLKAFSSGVIKEDNLQQVLLVLNFYFLLPYFTQLKGF